ncbi:MAG: DUF2330 domain-containing protein [Pirellulaceae bacterium]|nr:DUF2330 domain-containing protein [Pirellulaceae bacterium]
MNRQLALCVALPLLVALLALTPSSRVWGDGKVVPPREYAGSLEESSQEAIIIFTAGDGVNKSRQDLILKISVEGDVDSFAWIVPFPAPPETAKEDPKLFRELFDYAESRRARPPSKGEGAAPGQDAAGSLDSKDVEVISRKVVGSFDVAVVREQQAGTLNKWLEENGYQTLDDAEDVLEFYRRKSYVFACIRVSEAAVKKGQSIDIHPLRFSFTSGGRDGIYFPMKMTGLQTSPFNVNLYVFYGKWLNDKKSKYGYVHRGFGLHYRDWDTSQCEPNAGKSYSAPQTDPFLRSYARRLPKTVSLMQKRYPGEKFYLTNIQANQLDPAAVRDWTDDLWLFPYYTNKNFVPYDVRSGGPAALAWPNAENAQVTRPATRVVSKFPRWVFAAPLSLALVIGLVAVIAIRRRRDEPGPPGKHP